MRVKYWLMSRPLSEVGQTLPMDSAPVPPDVRCCAKSDHSRRECEMTRRAMYGRRPRCKRNLAFCEAFGCSHVSGLFLHGGVTSIAMSAAVAAGPDVIR